MNANEMTFGIEIECTLPAGTVRVGHYHVGNAVPFLPSGWLAMEDGSLRCRAGRQTVEIVSPVLRGADGLRQAVFVVEQLKARGADVNTSCGFHVHVGWAGDAAALQRLVNLTANFEGGIYAATGSKSRETSHYCRSVRQDFRAGVITNSGAIFGQGADRYHVLNLANLATGRKSTVEFRAFTGTVNAAKVVAWVRLCLALVERAQETSRKVQWDAKEPSERSPMRRKGAGYTQFTRLLYQVGWIKGRRDRACGAVLGDGLPDLDQSKGELRRLARKYDRGE